MKTLLTQLIENTKPIYANYMITFSCLFEGGLTDYRSLDTARQAAGRIWKTELKRVARVLSTKVSSKDEVSVQFVKESGLSNDRTPGLANVSVNGSTLANLYIYTSPLSAERNRPIITINLKK